MIKIQLRRACAAIVLFACAWAAQARIALDERVPIGAQVKVGTLANGLTYYIQRNAKPEKKLELRLVVKAGSILEDDDQQGLAHFTEHMAFNGSAHFKKHELVSYLQSIGVKFGADLNAYTSFDETVYLLQIPTDKKENIETGLLVLKDWAGGLTFNDADIDAERDIVLEELRSSKGAQERINKVLLPRQFNESTHARRLPIGLEGTIKSFPYDALKRFYRDWYRPELMAVIMVGDVEPAAAEKMVETLFSSLANPPNPRLRIYTRIAPRLQSEAVVITDKEAANNTISIQYPPQEVKQKTTFAEYRQELIEALFANMLGQRMRELTEQASPPFVTGGSHVTRLMYGYQYYNSSAVLGRRGVGPAVAALVQENARIRQFGFGADELARAKKNMMRDIERAYSERDKTDSASYVREYVGHFLEQDTIAGIDNEAAYVRELLPDIALADVNRHARATIPDPAAKLVVYTGSSGADAPAPTSAQLLDLVAAAEKTPVRARADKAVAASLMAEAPAPGKIIAESVNAALGLTELGLSNGLRVILKPTDFKNDQVVMGASRFGGQLLFDESDRFNARYASSVVAAMGLKDFSPVDLQNVLAGKSASVRASMSSYNDNLSGSAGSADIETMLQLAYLQFSGARKDENLFKSFIGKHQDMARNALSRPESLFGDTLFTTLYNAHPRATRVPRPEDFGAVSLERALDIYAQRFGSARGFTFIIVGSFDVARIKPLIATYLASLPTSAIPAGYRDVGIRPATGVIKKEVRAGSAPKSTISINFTGEAVYSEQEQLRFQGLLEVMNIRIKEVLREKLGLIYSGDLSGSLGKIPYGNYTMSASLPCGPENVDAVIAALFAEIRKVKDQGATPSDLNKVKQSWLKSHQASLRENRYWLSHLQDAVLLGADPASILRFADEVNALSAQDIKEAAARYFNTDNYVQVVLNPETRAQ